MPTVVEYSYIVDFVGDRGTHVEELKQIVVNAIRGSESNRLQTQNIWFIEDRGKNKKEISLLKE